MKVKAGGAVGPFADVRDGHDAVKVAPAEFYDLSLELETAQSGKPPYKLVPCTGCRRPMVVNTFYVLAWAKCHASGCSGESRGPATVAVAQAGRTEPSDAVNLDECVINDCFVEAHCPFGHGPMELKSVNHNPTHGPTAWKMMDGRRTLVQIEKGETVMHQCNTCKCVISLSTTAQSVFRRVNEVRPGKHVNGWGATLGIRGEEDATA